MFDISHTPINIFEFTFYARNKRARTIFQAGAGGGQHSLATVCPQKIQSLGIDTIFDAIFHEDLMKNKVSNC